MVWQGNAVHCSIHSKACAAESGRDAFLTTVTKNSCKTCAEVPKSIDSTSSIARFLLGSSLPAPTAAYTRTLVSKNALTVMQILPGPRFLAEPPLRSRTQLPQARPGALCPILVRGE